MAPGCRTRERRFLANCAPAGGSAYGSMLWPTKPRTAVCGVEQVLQLQYRVRWLSDDVSVRNDAAPVMVQLAGFSCSLSGETLIAEPSSDYSSVDAARAALEPALHAREASSELNQGLRFSFGYTGSLCTTWRPASSCRDRRCGRIESRGAGVTGTRRVSVPQDGSDRRALCSSPADP
jgi:hypothetical protein